MMNSQLVTSVGVLLGALCAGSTVQAALILGETTDQSITSFIAGPTGDITNGNLNLGSGRLASGRWAGGDGTVPRNASAIVVFELPNLGAIANPFATAELEFELEGKGGAPSFNLDLYGLDSAVSSSVDAETMHFVGPGPDPNAALVAEDVILPSTALGVYSADIASYLNAQYDSGAGIGEFVFLRFTPDYTNTGLVAEQDGGDDRYFINAADDDDETLQINYTAIPEPSSLILYGSLLIGAGLRRPTV